MKNEDKLLELLSETLRKQDRQGEILEKQGSILEKYGLILEKQEEIIEKQGSILEKLVEGQLRLIDEVVGLRGDFHKMNDHLLTRQDKTEERIGRLEERVFKD